MSFTVAVIVNVLIDLAVVAVLVAWFRRHRASRDIFVAWIAAFLARILALLLNFSYAYSAFSQFRGTITGVQFLLSIAFLVLLYWGVIRFIAHRPFWRNLFPLLYLFAAVVFGLVAVATRGSVTAFGSVGAFAIVAPMELILAIVFFFLHGILLGEHVRQRFGPLLLGLGFLLRACLTVVAPFFPEQSAAWLALRLIPEALFLYGFLRLHREADEFLANLRHPQRRYLSKSLDRV